MHDRSAINGHWLLHSRAGHPGLTPTRCIHQGFQAGADILHTDGLMTKTTPLNQASHGTGEAWPGAGCWVFLKP